MIKRNPTEVNCPTCQSGWYEPCKDPMTGATLTTVHQTRLDAAGHGTDN